MTPVTMRNFLGDSQANIAEFLKTFFDGSPHNVGTDSITFPLCDLKFGRQQLNRELTNPLIVVESGLGGVKDFFFGGSTKAKVQRDYPWRFIVITCRQNQDNAPDWKTNDHVSSLLTMLLNVSRVTLAAGGQRIINVGDVQKIPDPKYQFAVIPTVMRSNIEQLAN